MSAHPDPAAAGGAAAAATAVAYDRHGFRIDGRRRILLMGTISYFRLARADWRDRLQKLRDSGFNTVDVYVPWNFHESAEGIFDFTTGEHDLGAYLALCAELGLFVCLRPGPYICNEWDGGGLPAWLFTVPDVRLRQNDPVYLRYVRRYLSHLNAVVRPYQRTVKNSGGGGPIIVYQLENELDFFHCEDPAGYIAALRDGAREDGIDVPLIACVGNRTPIQKAMGLIPGVLPTPNIYVNPRTIVREAVHAREVVHAGVFKDGTPMSETPLFATEMGRDEISLRRVLSAGYKGLGPFNFAGGSNGGWWHAVNNWGGLTFLSTSIDFGGMVGYDGRLGRNYAGAQRLAGFVDAFEEEIALSDSVPSSEPHAPRCDNPALGVADAEDQPHRVFSLIGPAGETGGGEPPAFIFLANGTVEAQPAQVTVGSLTFPRRSHLVVAHGYDHLVVANVGLRRWGLDAVLRYCTAEVAAFEREEGSVGATARLVLCGEPGSQGELRLEAGEAMYLLGPEPEGVYPETGALTLVFGFERPFETTVVIGKNQRLLIKVIDKATAGRHDTAVVHDEATPSPSEPIELLEHTRRFERPVAAPASGSDWRTGPCESLERLGVLHGAGWYEIEFPARDAATTASEPPRLHLPSAADVVSVWAGDAFAGSFHGDGGPLDIPLPNGSRRVRVRTEIWGHSNFDDHRWPAARLGGLRGLQGAPRLDSTEAMRWRFVAEPASDAEGAAAEPSSARSGPVAIPGGEAREVRFPDLPGSGARHGAVLTLAGTNCIGEIRLGKRAIGRFLFGPEPTVKMTGGPPDRFFLSGSWLEDAPALTLVVRGAGRENCALTSAKLELLG